MTMQKAPGCAETVYSTPKPIGYELPTQVSERSHAVNGVVLSMAGFSTKRKVAKPIFIKIGVIPIIKSQCVIVENALDSVMPINTIECYKQRDSMKQVNAYAIHFALIIDGLRLC